MTPRRVVFTVTAQRHVHHEKQWWLSNRTHTEIFASELEHALKVVATLPGAGTDYPEAGVHGLRRVFLRKTACHVYYTFDDHTVIVRAVWGARKKHGPNLNP